MEDVKVRADTIKKLDYGEREITKMCQEQFTIKYDVRCLNVT